MWDCKSTCGATPSSSRFWICRHFWVTTLTDPFFNKGTVLSGSCMYIVISWLPFLESIGGEGIWCFLLATGISKDESPWIILVFLVEREPWPGKWDKKAGQRKRIYLKNVPKGFIGLGKKQQSLGWRKKFRKFWDWKYYMEPKNSSWTLSAAEAYLQKVQSFKWIRVFVSNPKWGRNMHWALSDWENLWWNPFLSVGL